MIPSTSLLANFRPSSPPPGGGSADILNRTVASISVSGATVVPAYRLDANGNVYNHNNTLLEGWLVSGTAAGHEARATLVSGDALFSGVVGTWQALGTSRSWSQRATVGQTKTSQLLIEIRNASTLVVQDDATINLTASSSNEGGGGEIP